MGYQEVNSDRLLHGRRGFLRDTLKARIRNAGKVPQLSTNGEPCQVELAACAELAHSRDVSEKVQPSEYGIPPKPERQRSRLPGLDLLRCIAVIAVVVHHYPRSPDQMVLRAASHYGWAGVDLFFVLSGYLIAGQFFASLVRGKPISIKSFYYRRSIRILPNYFFVLGCYVLLLGSQGKQVTDLWRYLTFTQNFGVGSIFLQSWSLCVEEHFYLLFPLVVWLLARSRSGTFGALLFCFTLAFGVGLRYAIWSRVRPDLIPEPHQAWGVFFGKIYFPTYTRLDGIACGVALGALEHLRPRIWQRIMNLGNWLLVPGLGLLTVSGIALRAQMGFFYCVLSFPILGLAFAFLVAAAVVPNGVLGRIRLPGVETLAVWSYAIYLTHVLALHAAGQLCERAGFQKYGIGMAIISIFAIGLTGAALFYCVERVFLRIRDRSERSLGTARRLVT